MSPRRWRLVTVAAALVAAVLLCGCSHREASLARQYAGLTRAQQYTVEDRMRARGWGANGCEPSYWAGFALYLEDLETVMGRVRRGEPDDPVVRPRAWYNDGGVLRNALDMSIKPTAKE